MRECIFRVKITKSLSFFINLINEMINKMVNKKIGLCGCEIFEIERFKGLYCYDYCCLHCPDSKIFPCQKEKIEGTAIENLAKTQLG